MENNPFNQSSRTARSPPPTPSPIPASASRPEVASQDNDAFEALSASDLQFWMSSIEQFLSEVCCIAAEGKLNSDQKLRINGLCRKVGNGIPQMAVHYQSLRIKAVQAHSSLKALQVQIDLSEQLQDLKKCVENTSKPVNSFAAVVKKGTNSFIKTTNVNSVAIYPEDKLKSSEETKKSLVQKIIYPEQMKLHVRGLRKTKNGGVIISTETKEDIEKLKQSVQLTKSGFKADEPYKQKPRVVVFGVPTSMEEKEVFTCLYHQNLADELHESTHEAFLGSIKLSHKSGKKNFETCNYVIQVSAVIRKALITKERVFLNWSSCPVRDFTLVTRCYKCQQYGHAAKICRETTYTCGHCGDQGHTIKECLRKNDQPKCASCSCFKKPSKHCTGPADCPARIMAERKYINFIDYGIA